MRFAPVARKEMIPERKKEAMAERRMIHGKRSDGGSSDMANGVCNHVPRVAEMRRLGNHATSFNMRKRGADDAAIIAHLRAEFTEERRGRRIFLATGTVAKRPRQWLLLGVLRVQDAAPGQLALL
jgi:hypothetical protein